MIVLNIFLVASENDLKCPVTLFSLLQEEEEEAKSAYSQQDKFKEIHELAFKSPGRVKEHAQKLNKIASESDIKPPMPVNNNQQFNKVSESLQNSKR